MAFRMISERTSTKSPEKTDPTIKPETVMVFESDCWFERPASEPVHYRNPEPDEFQEIDPHRKCDKCGGFAKIWYASEERWEDHPMRCS